MYIKIAILSRFAWAVQDDKNHFSFCQLEQPRKTILLFSFVSLSSSVFVHVIVSLSEYYFFYLLLFIVFFL